MSFQRHSNTDGTYGYQVGTVGLDDFDIGLVKSLGGTVSGKSFVLNYTGLEANIPVTFENPEQPLRDGIVPCMVVLRDDIQFISTPRLQRTDDEYRIPAPNALVITNGDTTGYSAYVVSPSARQVDIMYTIQIYHRTRQLAQIFFLEVVKKFLPHDYITVVDSIGNSRIYSAYLEGQSKLDEILSVTQRYLGFAFTVRVEGEINLVSVGTETGIIDSEVSFTREVLNNENS